jgi:hypothetical protein
MISGRERFGLSRGAGAAACLAVLLACGGCGGGEPTTPVTPPPPGQQEIPISGAAVPGMEAFEQTVRDLLE